MRLPGPEHALHSVAIHPRGAAAALAHPLLPRPLVLLDPVETAAAAGVESVGVALIALAQVVVVAWRSSGRSC